MTREELHALVWSKPMRTAAAERGISDVALAKQCRKAGVPVPPRGYWNKVQAGKATVAQPLPPLPPTPLQKAGLGSLFPALRATPAPGTTGDDGTPLRPEFLDMVEVTRRIEEAVGDVKVPARLDRSHPIVAKLLEQEARRQAARRPGDSSYYDLFHLNLSTPLQQRRLRILSALLLALGRLGVTAHGSTHAGERFSLYVGARSVNILIAVENGPRGDPFYRGRGAGRTEGQRIRLDIVGHSPDRERPHRTWRDGDVPLERQLTDVVRGLLIHSEQVARESALWNYDWQVKERLRKAEEARLAAQQAEAERVAREEAAAKARLAALVDGANDLERAERIRRYVAAVRQRYAALPDMLAPALLDRWAAWALGEADALDPVLSGRILRDARLHE